MYHQAPMPMYAAAKPWQWHTVETRSAVYSITPVFEAPQPPQLTLPPNPFALPTPPPEEPPKAPPSDQPEAQPEAQPAPSEEAPPSEETPPPEGGAPPEEPGEFVLIV